MWTSPFEITLVSKNLKDLKCIEASGLTPASRAYFVSRLLTNESLKALVVCPTVEEAEAFFQNVKTLFQAFPENTPVMDFYPGWEHSPYDSFQPSIKNRIRRIRCLHRVSIGNTRLIVTDALSLLQRCPTAESLLDRTFHLKRGDFIERSALVDQLEKSGLTRNDPVEDPGYYSVRGNLVDIFSPVSRHPVRIEFLGDEIEKIRAYDPQSQRTTTTLDEVTIIPITEFSYSEESVTCAKQNIKHFCDEHGLPKAARDSLFEQLDTRVHDPSFDYLLPFFFKEPLPWLFDYLDSSWIVAMSDQLGIQSAIDRAHESLKKDFEHSLAENRIAAPWPLLFKDSESLKKQSQYAPRLLLDPLALGVEDNPPEDEEEAAKEKDLATQTKFYFHTHAGTDLKTLEEKAAAWNDRGFSRWIFASSKSQAERTSFILSQKNIACRVTEKLDLKDTSVFQIVEGALTAGFRVPEQKLVVITDSEIFGPKKTRTNIKREPRPELEGLSSFVASLGDLETGDFVVHKLHGIGKYHGLKKLHLEEIPQDFLLLEYAGGDKLYLPVYRLDQVQKYIGSDNLITLDKLGSQAFEKTKIKVKADLQDLARKLLELYASRASREAQVFSAPDELYREFEAKFPFAETPDQLKAIEDVMNDLTSDKIMDRLVCGDVGYGKTEVAMRAAFLAVSEKKQVAVLVPTTVLSLQHERSFRQRFKDTGVNIGVLSRFKNPKEIKETLTALRDGKVDIVIGTHRLLSKDVAFKDLGLIIVDEEQRFGVEHKERLKTLRVNTDVITLTATPIPRTLHMSLMGLRDISIINTAPVDRLSVRTYISRFDEDIIRKAIQFEKNRGGQIFFIHNRVQSINAMADRLREIVPEAKIIVAHGQLDERQLEERMIEFYNRQADVLLCSTIIESGLDIPTANTMIINQAHMFGLAQLYQLRGRVGRSQVRAYCYLLLPEQGNITEDAKNRLEVIQRFADLGSGFKVASEDLEQRGGGDLLGKSQSGHVAAIGYELYLELLDETIRELKGQQIEERFDPEIKIPVPAILPEEYVPDVHQRLSFYKRLSQSTNIDRLHDLELELTDRFGKPPLEVDNLFWLIRIKQLLADRHIKSLIVGKEKLSLDASAAQRVSLSKFMELLKKSPHIYSTTPDSKIVLKKPFRTIQGLHQDLNAFFTLVAEQ